MDVSHLVSYHLVSSVILARRTCCETLFNLIIINFNPHLHISYTTTKKSQIAFVSPVLAARVT